MPSGVLEMNNSVRFVLVLIVLNDSGLRKAIVPLK